MKQYPITYWYGIRPEFISRERLEEAKEAGFNLIECDYGREMNLRVLAWCEELGLMANVRDGRIDHALGGHEGWEARLDEMFEDYAPFSTTINRYFVRDEPVNAYFPTLGRVADYLNAHDPAHGEYINLLPYHAVPREESETLTEGYQRHIDEYCDMVHPTILSYDHYNLKFKEVESLEGEVEAPVSDENRARNSWEGKLFAAWDDYYYYNNLEMIRENAARRGLPWMDIILLVEHWHYRLPTEAEVRWEAFTALAYGSTALSYFTYWTPGASHSEPWSYHNGIILTDGRRGEKYEIVKAINAELQALYAGLTLPLPGETQPPMAMHSRAVFHIGSEMPTNDLVKPFCAFEKLSGIKDASPALRLIVGHFDGDRFMLVNKDYSSPATVTLTVDGSLYRLNKATATWEPCSLTITLAPGDGELFGVM